MDYNYHQQTPPPEQPPYPAPQNDYRVYTPNGLATASMILGIISLVTACCLYIAIPCGALGILLAILSKGKEHALHSRAKLGLGLSIGGFAATVIFTGIILIANLGIVDSPEFQEYFDSYQNFYYENEVLPYESPDIQNPPADKVI